MPDKSLATYLKKSFVTGAFKTVAVTLSTLIFLPLIIRQVGMETYGLISLTMVFGGLVVAADFGLAKSVTLLIGKADDKHSASGIVVNAFAIHLIFVALIGIVLLVLVVLGAPLLGERLDVTDSLKNYIIVIGYASLFVMLVNNLLVAILEAYFLMHYANVGFIISSIAINAFIYIASLMSDSIYILLAAPIAALALVSVYLTYVVRLHTRV